MKDVILPRLLDDATFATLSSIMVFNNVDVSHALLLRKLDLFILFVTSHTLW